MHISECAGAYPMNDQTSGSVYNTHCRSMVWVIQLEDSFLLCWQRVFRVHKVLMFCKHLYCKYLLVSTSNGQICSFLTIYISKLIYIIIYWLLSSFKMDSLKNTKPSKKKRKKAPIIPISFLQLIITDLEALQFLLSTQEFPPFSSGCSALTGAPTLTPGASADC